MPMTIKYLLTSAGIPLTKVRFLRHKDTRAERGRTPFDLWRQSPERFDLYQRVQTIDNASRLAGSFWASFVGTPADETLFVGLFAVKNRKVNDVDIPQPHRDGFDKAGKFHIYELVLDDRLSEYIGRVVIDWGPGDRSWIQRADNQEKRILELRTAFREPEFPGYLEFIEPLSRLEKLPMTWITALRAASGVYLLTCPKTKEQYVGSAYGEAGFCRRWLQYVQTGHGGNVKLKSKEPSDYQVADLEVAGSADAVDEILKMEALWKRKLRTRDMGLNGN